MFKRLAIEKMIIFGFFIVLVLLAGISGTGYHGLTTAASGFTDYREMARDSNLAGRLQAILLMARTSVKDYLINGIQKTLQTFNKRWKKVEVFQAEAQKEINAPVRAVKTDQIDEAHGKYKPAFAKVTKLMLPAQEDKGMSAVFYSHLLIAFEHSSKGALPCSRCPSHLCNWDKSEVRHHA